MGNIIVIGAGAAGMMAAVVAAQNGHTVTVYEQNEKVGKKLFITGKGRCNVTNDTDTENLLSCVISNRKFLYSAFYEFDSYAVMQFFEKLGVKLKVERGNRVFPQSDHSSDIIRALEKEMARCKVTVHLKTKVVKLLLSLQDGQKYVEGVVLSNGKKVHADRVILATGGVSYPLTGADGSGLEMAQNAGITVTELYPALVPLRIKEKWCRDLMGLSLKNVSVAIRDEKKMYYTNRGEMLFTHYGVSGPLILSASSMITKRVKNSDLILEIDLKPALTMEQLDKRLLRDFDEAGNKTLKNAMVKLLPSRLIPIVLQYAHLSENEKVNELTRNKRQDLCATLKCLRLTITDTADFNEAIITQGGISVKEVNPSTMEAKKIKNLFLAGECLDLDALTGGFNLQIAWSTGFLAGNNV